jgi:hypothetical protein
VVRPVAAGERKGAWRRGEPVPAGPVVAVAMRESGDALLRALLEGLLEAVPDAVGCAVGVADGGFVRHVATVGEVSPGGETEREALSRGRPVLGTPAADARGEVDARGVVAVPGEQSELAALVVALWLAREPRPEDAQVVERMQPVLTCAVAVVEYCAGEEQRAEQMVQMVQYRRVIEQAKGVVMAATGADADAAFATLARGSQHFNVRLRNMAVALVELVGGASAEGPDDPAAVVTPSAHERHAAEQVWAALSSGPPAGAGGGA